jgi:hypothetical protein
MASEQTPVAPEADSGQQVDRIREIIFGTQMRDYGQRFQALQEDVDRLRQELGRLSQRQDEQQKGQGAELQSLRSDLGRTADDLRSEFRQVAEQLEAEKVAWATLGELLIGLGTKLQSGDSLADLLKGLAATEAD